MKLKLATLLFVALAYSAAPAAAQQAVGSVQTFAVLGNTTVTNGGATMISGNLGVSPGTAITGFPPGTLASGMTYTGANAVVAQAHSDAQTLYNALVAEPCATNLSGTDLGGLTLTPGVYCFDGAATLTAGNATLTLDAQNGSGVFVFQIGTTLTTGTNSAVNVINGNSATGVFWQLGTSATLGTGTMFAGNIVAHTSITVVSTAQILCGRALALNGAVTLDTNTVSDDCTSHNFSTGRADFGSLGFAGAHASRASHDFNVDTYSDILWRDTGGDAAIWLMTGATIQQGISLGNVSTDWSIVGTRDFNGDGVADILWRDTAGDVLISRMNSNGTVAQYFELGDMPTTWSVSATADFNGDGKGDILWRDTSGNLKVWFMNGFTVSEVPIANVPTIWSVAGIGDFNGVGNRDIICHDNYGDVSIWEMNGAMIQQGVGLGNVPTNWSIAGTGDFNGDGTSDIVWRDTAGDVMIWLMNNNGSVSQSSVLGNVPTTWSVVETGDFNSDGMIDILWLDNSGNVKIWFMNGFSVSEVILGNVGTAWAVQGANAD